MALRRHLLRPLCTTVRPSETNLDIVFVATLAVHLSSVWCFVQFVRLEGRQRIFFLWLLVSGLCLSSFSPSLWFNILSNIKALFQFLLSVSNL